MCVIDKNSSTFIPLVSRTPNPTSSFAVAERPRDALCPSVVSLNKITRAEFFYYCYLGFRLISAQRCLRRNVEASCHTLRSCFLPRCHQQNSVAHQRLVLYTRHGSSFVAAKFTAVGRLHQHTQWSQILAQNRDFCLPHLHSTPALGGSRRNIAMPFGIEKLEWLGYQMVKKIWRHVYSFWQNSETWQTDRQTDTHTQTDTAWRHRPRLHSIARQKK